MTNAQWLGDYQVEGYDLYNLGLYPGIVAGEGRVCCEVYRIDATTLGELDALRTRGGEYKRQLISTPYGTAWMYIYQRPVVRSQQIISGDWLKKDSEN
ncbi:gamma-glutamylcyclotransferase [Tatumella punctata]